jgi:hypothetical protein
MVEVSRGGFVMSQVEILDELRKLSRTDRREILNRILELDDEVEVLEDHRHMADEAFQMLDKMEAADAANSAR